MTALDFPTWFFRVFAFVFGAAWGSFANVVIYRWPLGLSVVSPASRCPHCEKPVRAYDNVPIFAWFWLRGRCRDCKAPFSPRYALVEAMYAVSALALVELLLRTQGSQALPTFFALFFVRFAFVWGLLTASFIDLDTMLLPTFITRGGAVLGVAASVMLPGIGWKASLAGAALGYAIPYAFHFVWERFLKRQGMGLGDAELLAMVGALLGHHGVLFALFAGSLQGIVATLLSKATGWKLTPDIPADYWEDGDDDEGDEEKKVEPAATAEGTEAAAEPAKVDPNVGQPLMRTMLPFGPFLALGGIEYLLGGDQLMRAYLSMLQGR